MKKIKSLAVMIAASVAVFQFGGISCFKSTVEASQNASQLNLIRKKAVTDYSKYQDNEMLVIYQDGTKTKEKKQICSQANAKSSDTVTDWCDKIVLKDGQDLEQAVKTLAQDEDVLYVQPNFKYTALSTTSSAASLHSRCTLSPSGSEQVALRSAKKRPSFISRVDLAVKLSITGAVLVTVILAKPLVRFPASSRTVAMMV